MNIAKKIGKIGLILILLNVSAIAAEKVLAVVNGDKVTTEVAPKDFETMDKNLQDKIVQRLIEKRLASQYALSRKDIVESDEYKKVLQHVLNIQEKQITQKKQPLANLLKNKKIKGYTEEQLMSKKGLLAFDFVLNKKAEEFEKNTKEMKEYYKNNKFKYDTPEMVEFYNIVVEDKTLAQKIFQKVKDANNSLETFMQLAKKYSKAPEASEGGYFGKMPTSDLNDVVKDKILKLKRGEVSQPVKTIFGYQIFLLVNHIPKYKSTFNEVASQVRNDYVAKNVKLWAKEKIESLKKDAKITLKHDS